MAKSDYRPGRRRKPTIAALLDWAAGILIAVLLVMLGSGVVTLFVRPGIERIGAMIVMLFVVWPIGSALGVWLSVGRPLTARGLGYAFGFTLLGVGVLVSPFLLDIEQDVVRGLAGAAALIGAPAFARIGLGLARRVEA